MQRNADSLENLQSKCRQLNLHNDLIQSITTINFRNPSARDDLKLMIDALHWVMCLNENSHLCYEHMKSFGKTSKTVNGTVIDLGDIFVKILDGTYENGEGPARSEELSQHNIITLCLLYLNNFESQEIDTKMENIITILTLDKSQSAFIIWCFLAILKKVVGTGIEKENLPPWLPITSVFSSNIEICNKLISHVKNMFTPHLLFKKVALEQFWEMAEDNNKTVEFEDAQSSDENLIGAFLELAVAPDFLNDENYQNEIIVSVACKAFCSAKIDRIDKDVLYQLLRNFLDVLKATSYAESIWNLLRAVDKVLSVLTLHRNDVESITDELIRIADQNNHLVNTFLHVKHREIFLILLKVPELLDLKTRIVHLEEYLPKLDKSSKVVFARQCMRMLEKEQPQNGVVIFRCIEIIFQSLEADGYNIKEQTKYVVRCAEKCSETFNKFALHNVSTKLISMVLPVEGLLDMDVKIRHFSLIIATMPKSFLATFLSDYLQKLEAETLLQNDNLMNVQILIESIYSSEYELSGNYSHLIEPLRRHHTLINTIFRKIELSPLLLRLVMPHSQLLDTDIQFKYLYSFIEFSTESSLLSTMIKCLGLLKAPNPQFEHKIVSEATQRLLMHFECRDVRQFKRFLEQHCNELNEILRTTNLTWLYSMLSRYPKILAVDVNIMFFQEVGQNLDASSLWNLLSNCLHTLADLLHISSTHFKDINLPLFTENLFLRLTNTNNTHQNTSLFRGFAESHKTQFNTILRIECDVLNGPIFDKLICMSEILDFDVKLQYLDRGIDDMGQWKMLDLLSECLTEYEQSENAMFKQKIPAAIFTLTTHLDDNSNQFRNVAKSHQTTINRILRENIDCPQSESLCSSCWQYSTFLEFDVKCLYVKFELVQLTVTEITSLIEECLSLIEQHNQQSDSKIYEVLSTIDSALKMCDCLVPDSTKSMLTQYAEKHQGIIDKFFRRYSRRRHLQNLLTNELDSNRGVDNGEPITVYQNEEEFWDNAAKSLQRLSKTNDKKKFTQRCENIFSMFSGVDINGETFRRFFESHKNLINTVLRRSQSMKLFILLSPYISKMHKDVQIKCVMKANKSLCYRRKYIILEALFVEMTALPTENIVGSLLPLVGILFSSFEPPHFLRARHNIINFATNNFQVFNKVLCKNKSTLNGKDILKAIGSDQQVLNLDVKMMYLDKLVDILSETDLLNILSECLSCKDDNNQFNHTPQLRTTINKLCKALTKKVISSNSIPHLEFAAKNQDTIEFLLNRSTNDYDKSMFLLLAPFPQFVSFDMKMQFVDIFLKYINKRSHWQLLEECMEQHIKHSKPGMTGKIVEIVYLATRAPFTLESYHNQFAEKYKDTLNDFIVDDGSTAYSIANFLAYFPQFMTFDTKINTFPLVLKRIDNNLLFQFVHECLINLKFPFGVNVSKVSATLLSIIERVPTDNAQGRAVLSNISDQYAPELRNVLKFMSFRKSPAWRIILEKLGISMDFESKIEWLRQQLVDELAFRSPTRIEVKRLSVLSDSYFSLNNRPVFIWKSLFRIRFTGESGIDAGGLMREWFTILAREIFNPNYALFIPASDDNNVYTINKSSHVNPDHLEYFKFIGRFIGKSIRDRQCIHCPFTKSLYKHILDIPVGFEDFQREDSVYCNSLKSLLNNPLHELGLDLTFSTEIDEFGVIVVKDLMNNGRNVKVTDDNKKEYVRLLCQMKMTGSIRRQLDAFCIGFYEMVPKHVISMFTENELELLICGESEINIDDLQENTRYELYNSSDITIVWFWKAVRTFGKDDKSRLLMFVTGSSKAPLFGFASNSERKFVITKDTANNKNRLPTSHTCAHQLVLPQYDSFEKLQQSLQTAIREGNEGFAFV